MSRFVLLSKYWEQKAVVVEKDAERQKKLAHVQEPATADGGGAL
eukprot:SAG22_NODE_1490_length_4307_cov_6.140684_3_plen_44_part_00